MIPSRPPAVPAYWLYGHPVTSACGASVGHLHDVGIDPSSGRATCAVVAPVSAPGRVCAVPWSALQAAADGEQFVTTLTPGDLDRAPSFETSGLGLFGDEPYRLFLAAVSASGVLRPGAFGVWGARLRGAGAAVPLIAGAAGLTVLGAGVAAGATPLPTLALGVLFVWPLLVGAALVVGAVVGYRHPSGHDLLSSRQGTLGAMDQFPPPDSSGPQGQAVGVDFEVVRHPQGTHHGSAEGAAGGSPPIEPASVLPARGSAPTALPDPHAPVSSRRLVKTCVEAGAAGRPICALELPRGGARAMGLWRGDCYVADPTEETVLVAADLVVFVVAADHYASVQRALIAEGLTVV